jgi:hypothetical protein
MNKIVTLLLSLFIVFTSCTKDDEFINPKDDLPTVELFKHKQHDYGIRVLDRVGQTLVVREIYNNHTELDCIPFEMTIQTLQAFFEPCNLCLDLCA